MSAADPHTDDLADRLDYEADAMEEHAEAMASMVPDSVYDDTFETWMGPVRAMRAAAAELRRLRHRDAALTTLLDAVGEGACKGVLDCWTPITYDAYGDGTPVERECGDCPPCRIAAAVEGIDQEHER